MHRAAGELGGRARGRLRAPDATRSQASAASGAAGRVEARAPPAGAPPRPLAKFMQRSSKREGAAAPAAVPGGPSAAPSRPPASRDRVERGSLGGSRAGRGQAALLDRPPARAALSCARREAGAGQTAADATRDPREDAPGSSGHGKCANSAGAGGGGRRPRRRLAGRAGGRRAARGPRGPRPGRLHGTGGYGGAAGRAAPGRPGRLTPPGGGRRGARSRSRAPRGVERGAPAAGRLPRLRPPPAWLPRSPASTRPPSRSEYRLPASIGEALSGTGAGRNQAPTRGPPGRDAGPGRSGVPPTACHTPGCDRRAVLVSGRCRARCCPRHAHSAWGTADGVLCVPCLTAPVPMRPRHGQDAPVGPPGRP